MNSKERNSWEFLRMYAGFAGNGAKGAVVLKKSSENNRLDRRISVAPDIRIYCASTKRAHRFQKKICEMGAILWTIPGQGSRAESPTGHTGSMPRYPTISR